MKDVTIFAVALGALGLSAWIGWVDYAVIPALALLFAVATYGLWRRRTALCGSPRTHSSTRSGREGSRHG